MNEELPQISVALVTRNRPESLERTLKSLRAQDRQPYEVVVSDDSDEAQASGTQHVVEAYGGRYIRGPRLGLYANRNWIAKECRGTHIRTMDDDHEFPTGHWKACEDAVVSDPNAVWIVGEFYPGDAMIGTPLCPGQLVARGFSKLPPDHQNSWAIADGAAIYPRSIFDRGVGYLDDFKFGAAYLEFGSALYWLGYRIRQVQHTYVLHHYDPKARSFMDSDIDLASRFTAMLCHSFLYQPTLENRALTLAEFGKHLAKNGRMAVRAVKLARLSYQRRKRAMLALKTARQP